MAFQSISADGMLLDVKNRPSHPTTWLLAFDLTSGVNIMTGVFPTGNRHHQIMQAWPISAILSCQTGSELAVVSESKVLLANHLWHFCQMIQHMSSIRNLLAKHH